MNSRLKWMMPGAGVWVTITAAGGKARECSGEIAHLYAGGATVIVDGVPGLPRAFLYSELRPNKGRTAHENAAP